MERRRLVRVPASSANLGPGFDSFAVALSLSLEVEVTETGSFSVQSDLDLPLDRGNFVVQGFERLHPADDFSFRISSSIPLSGGLGTSAASFVAGLMVHGVPDGVERVACVLTGHGLKDPDTALSSADPVIPCDPEIDAVVEAIWGSG